jgi:predicted 3-demethylubiquinone-9 3-methyltransferase (glyoxalase superfamily)
MDKLTNCLWFDHQAEEAATLYTSLLPDSRIDSIDRAPSDYPDGRQGQVLMVHFTLAGRSFQGLNGGPMFRFTEAFSMAVTTTDQAETDRLWDALLADGGTPSRCGWLKDRFGLSWQIVPRRLGELMGSRDRAAAKRVMDAMLTMAKLDVAALERAHEGV